MGLLRDATATIYAAAEIKEELKEKFLSQIARKGRASIVEDVVVKTDNNIVYIQGEFTWFVQNIL